MAKVETTFPNNPTWEQKCKAAWSTVAKLEAELLGAARTIYDLNSRLGRGETAEAMERELRHKIRSLESEAREEREVRRKDFAAQDERLATALARVQELETVERCESAEDETVDTCAAVATEEMDEVLTGIIRHIKAVRRDYR